MRCTRCGSMNFVMVPRKKYSWSIAIVSMIIIALVILPAFPLGLLLGFIGKTKMYVFVIIAEIPGICNVRRSEKSGCFFNCKITLTNDIK